MAYSRPTRRRTRRNSRIRIAGLLIALAVAFASLGYQLLNSSSSTAAAPVDVPRSQDRGALGEPAPSPSQTGAPPRGALPGEHGAALGEADGAVPEGTTVFDDDVPGVAKLDPALLSALRRAATDASGDVVEFYVDSGWRSPAYQEHLLEEAIAKYGTAKEAARWVATPTTSPHVSGDAIDIGHSDATTWLSKHGAKYGLCQIYRNEPWHFELRAAAIDHGCPAMYADPTHDPRMHE